MIQSFEAIIDTTGKVQLLESVQLSTLRRAILTILDEQPVNTISETALLSETALAEDCLKQQEHEAWSYLQKVQS